MDEKKLKALAAELANGLKTEADLGNDSNLLIMLYVQIMTDDLVMQRHRF